MNNSTTTSAPTVNTYINGLNDLQSDGSHKGRLTGAKNGTSLLGGILDGSITCVPYHFDKTPAQNKVLRAEWFAANGLTDPKA